MGMDIAFWTLAALLIASALGVVMIRNLFRAALCLMLCFLIVAGIFIMLGADFLAVIQILINVGAVAVLIILAIMLSREIESGNRSNRLILASLCSAFAFIGLAIYSVINTSWQIVSTQPNELTVSTLAFQLFSEDGFILPVEIAAVLILATIIGAIVMMREE
jgi:NADH-quinone oxidoreductase subunit J